MKMSNIPSLPDLETDEVSLFLTEDFQTRIFPCETESDDCRERPEQFMADDNSSDGWTKRQIDYRSIIPETGDISAAAADSVSNLVSLTEKENEDKSEVDGTQMTVAKERKEDSHNLGGKISGRITSYVDMQTSSELRDDNPVLEEFKGLAISKTDYTDRIDNVDSFNDLEELEEQDEDGDTLLHQAIILESPYLASVLIQIMVQNGLDLSMRNLLFQTPLHLAVLTAQTALVQELVKNCADVSVRDKNGRTPIHVACEMRRPDLVGFLSAPQEKRSFKKGSGIAQPGNVLDIKNYDGEGCVHIAAKLRDINLMKCLIKHGANVNLADEKSGRTPLHFAAECGDLGMVKYLLGIRNVYASPKTLNGETPIVLAYLRDFDEIVELFKEKRNT